MSRARQYPVAGDPGPIPADKPTPTRDQLLMILDIARTGVMTRPELLLSAARLFGIQPAEQRSNEATAWARKVMDYPATERLIERMDQDGVIVGREAWEWAEVGHRIYGAQARTTYFMTARRAAELTEQHEKHRDDELWWQAGLAADQAMRRLQPDQWGRLRDEAYDALRKGARSAHNDTKEP